MNYPPPTLTYVSLEVGGGTQGFDKKQEMILTEIKYGVRIRAVIKKGKGTTCIKNMQVVLDISTSRCKRIIARREVRKSAMMRNVTEQASLVLLPHCK